MTAGKIILVVLSILSLVAIFYLSLRADPMPLRKEFTKPFSASTTKWIRRSYMEVRHLPAYLIFTVLVQLAVGGSRSRAIKIMTGLLLLAAILEVAQIWLPHREADFKDFLWGALGIVAGSVPWLYRKPLPKTD